METSQALAIVFMFTIVIQFCVDRVKGIVGETVMTYIKAPVWALLFGILFSFLFRLDIFSMFGYNSQMPILAYILTGLILSAGASPIHELVETIRNSRLNS